VGRERGEETGDAMTEPPAGELGYQTRALSRALAILEAFDADGDPLTVAKLHESLELPKSTIVRLANVLERYGYLQHRNQQYELGPKTFELGALYLRRNGIPDVMRPILEQARDELEETICFACLSGSDVVHLDVIASPHPIQYRTDIGSRVPAHATALGKAILAASDDRAVRQALGAPPYARFTPNTLADGAALAADLELTRKRGYSLDWEESLPGLRCVGIAIQMPLLGRIAISASASPTSITEDTVPRFAEALLRAGQRAEAALDGRSRRTLADVPS
jgi:IclR family acetate operon transcriptional repressor